MIAHTLRRPPLAQRSTVHPDAPYVCLLVGLLSTLSPVVPLSACPFCTALRPTLSQQRETAAVVALGELTASDGPRHTFRLHQVTSGRDRLGTAEVVTLSGELSAKSGALVLLMAHEPDSVAAPSGKTSDNTSGKTPAKPVAAFDLAWTMIGVNETSYGYFVRAPAARGTPGERLKYFVRFLEHADPLVAEDAYQEFGHAKFDDVAAVADQLPYGKMRDWLQDASMPQARKGFYAISLALAKADGKADGKNEADRRANVALLKRLVGDPASDFRAGFDGALGGYLLIDGDAALDVIEKRFFADPRAADGDVRHAMAALRFYWEFGRQIKPQRLRAAMRRLLDRAEFAPPAIIDLARWEDWDALDRVAALYDRPGYPQPGTRRAVVAYLDACPAAAAAAKLAELRRRDPQGVRDAEAALSPGAARQ
jgi:hypothetical protein